MARRPAAAQVHTLNNIREGAFRLFGRYGYDGVSIEDIADAARLSKGALYWHFRGKDELFLDCLQCLHAIFDQYIFDPMKREKDPILRVLTLFQGLEQLLQDPWVVQGIAGYWLSPNNTLQPAIDEAHSAFEKRTAASIREALQLAMDHGLLDMASDLDDMSRAMITLMEAIVLPLRSRTTEETHRTIVVLARALLRAYSRDERLVTLADRVLSPAACRQ